MHDLIPLIYPGWHAASDYFDGTVRRSALMSDLILTDSEHARKTVLDYYYNIPPNKVRVVYP